MQESRVGCPLIRGDDEHWTSWLVLGEDRCCPAGVGEGKDETCLQVVGRPYCAVCYGLLDRHEVAHVHNLRTHMDLLC